MNQNQTVSPSGKKRRWRYLALRLIAIYLGIGLAISCAENLWGTTTGGVSAFVWTVSLKGNAILLFWWFIVPAITWPYDFHSALDHKVFDSVWPERACW